MHHTNNRIYIWGFHGSNCFAFWPSGLRHHVFLWADTAISEQHATSIFSPKMETACASEMLVPTNKSTGCHNPEDHSLNNKIMEALYYKSYQHNNIWLFFLWTDRKFKMCLCDLCPNSEPRGKKSRNMMNPPPLK
jgi:hypothetical protein